MKTKTPSIKTLRAVFGENAKEAKRILQATRAELETIPAGAARVRECYHPPSTKDLRLTCLDKLAGTFGVEAFQTTAGDYCEYLNAGDTYTTTLLWFRGAYRVGCWGDIAEKHCL